MTRAGSGYGWQEGRRVVPAYALTQGRTRPAGYELALETVVASTELAGRYESTLQMEWQAIVAMAARPISVAEIGAGLSLPLGVARVLVSELAEAGYLSVSLPIPVDENGRPGREILERLLDGLRAR
jgi:hypothetical protein